MIGNDIVDIAKAKEESNWQRPRFLDKLFTQKEQETITNAEDSFLMVWRLWSMKEAAYKLYTQLYPSRFYSPKKFECFIGNKHNVVKFQDFNCYTETRITLDYILSEASLKPSELASKVVQFQTKNIKSSSLILKQKLMNSFSENFRISKEEFTFTKDDFGIPYIKFQNNKTHLSVTHHGQFGAYVYSKY